MERCDGCGFEYASVPTGEIASRIDAAGPRYAALLVPPNRPPRWAERVRATPHAVIWSALQHACDVRDVLLVQRERLLLALVEDQPSVAPTYREHRAALAGYRDQDPGAVAVQLAMAATLLADVFARMGDRQFARTLVVRDGPEPTVHDLRWLGRDCVHEIEHHLGDVRAALSNATRDG